MKRYALFIGKIRIFFISHLLISLIEGTEVNKDLMLIFQATITKTAENFICYVSVFIFFLRK